MSEKDKRVTMLVRRTITEEVFVEIDQYPLSGPGGLEERAHRAASAVPDAEWRRYRSGKVAAWYATAHDIGNAQVWPDKK